MFWYLRNLYRALLGKPPIVFSVIEVELSEPITLKPGESFSFTVSKTEVFDPSATPSEK